MYSYRMVLDDEVVVKKQMLSDLIKAEILNPGELALAADSFACTVCKSITHKDKPCHCGDGCVLNEEQVLPLFISWVCTQKDWK